MQVKYLPLSSVQSLLSECAHDPEAVEALGELWIPRESFDNFIEDAYNLTSRDPESAEADPAPERGPEQDDNGSRSQDCEPEHSPRGCLAPEVASGQHDGVRRRREAFSLPKQGITQALAQITSRRSRPRFPRSRRKSRRAQR